MKKILKKPIEAGGLMYKSGIYLWKNKITGKVYIGQTRDLKLRKSQFLDKTRELYGGKYINNARRKYRNTPEVWEYKVLAYCDIESLNLLERTFITHFRDNGYALYNLTTGGDVEYHLDPEIVKDMKKKCRVNSDSNKRVIQKDLHGNTLAVYHSTREAEEKTGVNHASISMACRGKNCKIGHRSHRFLWFYEDDKE